MVAGDLKTRKCQCVSEDDRIGPIVIRGRPYCCLELGYVRSHREVLRTLESLQALRWLETFPLVFLARVPSVPLGIMREFVYPIGFVSSDCGVDLRVCAKLGEELLCTLSLCEEALTNLQIGQLIACWSQWVRKPCRSPSPCLFT